MKRLPLALVAGAVSFLAFPVAILIRGRNASGNYVSTSRGRDVFFSPEAIIGLLIVALIIVGASLFVYFRYKDQFGENENLSILDSSESDKSSPDK